MTFVSGSSVAGYLAPAVIPAPLEDDALADFLQGVVVGVTGMDGSLVRPRWQLNPPNRPDKSVTWLAIGVGRRTTEGFPQTTHGPDGDTLTRYERLDVMVSVYGPNAEAQAAFLRDGLFIAQNREAMAQQGYALRNVSDIDKAPELLNQQWIARADLTITLMRRIDRVYPVMSVTSTQGTLIAAAARGTIVDFITSQSVTPEPPIPPSPPPPVPPPPPGTQYGALYFQMTALQNLSTHMVVRASGDVGALYPNLMISGDGELVVGVTTGAGQLGSVVTVQGEGELVDAAWSWTPGPVFVGPNGQITQTPAFNVSWVRQIGVALAADRILIDLQPPVLL